MRIYNVFISWMRYPIIWKWSQGAWSNYRVKRQGTGPHHPLETFNRYAQGCWCPSYLVFRIDSCWISQGSQLELAISVGSPPRIIQLMINLVSRYFPPGILFVILKSYILSGSVQNPHIAIVGKNKHWTFIYSFSNIQIKIVLKDFSFFEFPS